MTKNRTLASLISNDTSKIKTVYTDSDSIVTSASLGVTAAAGTTTYSSADTLPASADNGDQALVTSTNRLYIFTNGGWYNIALINSTPYWITEADGSYTLSTTGGATIVEILAGDSDGTTPSYTATTDSDFNQVATITQDSDSRWIITPIDSENGTAVAGTGTVTFRATDGINLISTLSLFSLTFITAIENSAETTLLLKADTTGTDNQVDASTNNHTITETSNVTSSAFSPYHPGGYSTYFDGSGGYLSGNDMGLGGAGAFTVEAWMYPTVYNTYANDIYSHGANLSVGADFLAFGLKSDGNIQMFKGSGSPVLISTSAPCATLNQWYHVAFVRESNNNTSAYVNGVLVAGPTSISGNLTSAPSGRAFIGTQSYSAGAADRSFEGYMTDVRIVTDAVYTTNFTPPTARLTAIANTSLLTCHLPYIADSSSNNHTITIGGNTLTKRFGPYDYNDPYTKADHGGSLDFQAASTYMAVDSGAITSSWGNNFTIEFWLHRDALNDGTIFDNRIGAQYPGFFINAQSNGVAIYANASWLQQGIGNGSDYLGKWAHYALTFSGTEGKSFVNGKLTHTYTIPDTATYSYNKAQNTIGAKQYVTRGDQALGQYKARLADFRISTVLRYTTDFTPPTTAFVSDTDTLLLTCTNKNNIWDAGSGNILTKVGNATASNTQRQFTTSSAIYFDGSGDRITVPYSRSTSIGSGDFTVEWWMRPAANATMRPLGFDSNGAGTWIVVMYSSGTFDMAYETSAVFSSASSYSSGTWQHIAWTRSGSISRLFINGILDKTNSSFTYDFDQNTSHALQIGYNTAPNSSQAFNGYLQDLRITRGVARYTSNFTPPTAEFEG